MVKLACDIQKENRISKVKIFKGICIRILYFAALLEKYSSVVNA